MRAANLPKPCGSFPEIRTDLPLGHARGSLRTAGVTLACPSVSGAGAQVPGRIGIGCGRCRPLTPFLPLSPLAPFGVTLDPLAPFGVMLDPWAPFGVMLDPFTLGTFRLALRPF